MSDGIDWPSPPQDEEAVRQLFAAKVDVLKADRARIAALEDAAQKTEDDLRAAVHAAYIDVAKGGIDRSLERAKFVTAAAGSIVTLYTGLLALVYSLATNPIRPLPARGLAPAVFFALAFALSAAYVAFLRRHTMRGRPLPSGIGGDVAEKRLVSFIAWVSASVQQRAWAIRTGVISLGVGVALLPIPFLALKQWQTDTVIAAGAAVVAGWAVLVELAGAKRLRDFVARAK